MDDIADAFGHIPHRRLHDALRARGIDTAILELVGKTVSNGTNRGLPQGSPLSPLLANVYLDHVLDRGWRRSRPNTPLIRTADDMLIIARSETEAEEAYRELAQILIAAGMPLKGNRQNAIRNIDGQEVDWLGYRIQRRNGIIEARIGEKAWGKLGENLHLAHNHPKSPIRANETIRGWVTQRGGALSFRQAGHPAPRMRPLSFLRSHGGWCPYLKNNFRRLARELRLSPERHRNYTAVCDVQLPAQPAITQANVVAPLTLASFARSHHQAWPKFCSGQLAPERISSISKRTCPLLLASAPASRRHRTHRPQSVLLPVLRH